MAELTDLTTDELTDTTAAATAMTSAAASVSRVAERLRETLASRNMSQSELARRLAGPGAPQRVVDSRRRLISKWVAAEHAPAVRTAVALARILGVPDNFFVVAGDAAERRAAEVADGLDALRALEFARASKLAEPNLQARSFTLPLRREQIRALVPSFNPDWILLDQVSVLVPGERAEAEVVFHPDTIPGLGYWWAGSRLVPGMVQVEACAQLAALLLLTLPGNIDRTVLSAGSDKTRYRQPVKVGERLTLTCKVKKMRGDVVNVQAQGYLGNAVALRTELVVVTY